MALDERSRHELFLRLEEVLGAAPAETLMEMMPPVGWADVATKRDLDALEQRMDLRFHALEQRFDQRFENIDQRFENIDHRFENIDHRFENIDQRFENIDHRFENIDQRFENIDHRFETMEHKLIATFRGELLAAVTMQTRTLVLANLGAVLSTAVLAFGAAKLI